MSDTDDDLLSELFNPDLDNLVKIAGDGRWECRKCKNWNAHDSSCIGEPTDGLGSTVCGAMPPLVISVPDPARYTCPRCGNVNHFDSLCVAQVNGKMCRFSPLDKSEMSRPVHLSVMRQQKEPHLWNYETACGLTWESIGAQTAEPGDADCPKCYAALEKGLPEGVVLSRDGVGKQ